MSIISGQQGDGGAGSSAGSAAGAGAGNQAVTDWRGSLPEDLRSEKVFESIKGKDWNEAGPILAKSYLHSQRLVGADKIVIPGDKATPEERAAFYTKLGRPEKPDGYAYKLPEGMTEQMLDKARVDKWRGKMHELGFSKTQAETILNEFIADEYGNNTTSKANHDKEIQAWELGLKEEFGAKYDEKCNFARFAAGEYASPELVKLLETTGLGSHPEVVKMFASIGEKMSDDRARGGAGSGSGGNFSVKTQEQAQHALNEFNRDASKQKALWDRNHPEHANVVKERGELFAVAFPSEKEG